MWEVKVRRDECPYVQAFLHDNWKCRNTKNKSHICNEKNCPNKVEI